MVQQSVTVCTAWPLQISEASGSPSSAGPMCKLSAAFRLRVVWRGAALSVVVTAYLSWAALQFFAFDLQIRAVGLSPINLLKVRGLSAQFSTVWSTKLHLLLLHMLQVPGLKLGPETSCPDWCLTWFFSVILGACRNVSWARPPPLLCTSFPIYCTPYFNNSVAAATVSELLHSTSNNLET